MSDSRLSNGMGFGAANDNHPTNSHTGADPIYTHVIPDGAYHFDAVEHPRQAEAAGVTDQRRRVSMMAPTVSGCPACDRSPTARVPDAGLQIATGMPGADNLTCEGAAALGPGALCLAHRGPGRYASGTWTCHVRPGHPSHGERWPQASLKLGDPWPGAGWYSGIGGGSAHITRSWGFVIFDTDGEVMVAGVTWLTS
jgi:hypothetical protein